jgi:hypothetical protein
MTDSASQNRSELEKVVKQQILLSIALPFEEKGNLIMKLPSLNEKQLSQLKKVFDDESQRKEKLLTDFFEKNPSLFPEYQHFAQHHVNSIYHDVEKGEKDSETKRQEVLLTLTF